MRIFSPEGLTITFVELHPFLRRGRPIAMAHRGGAKEAPENTPAAFQRAIDLGFSYVESDLRTTRDGVVVLHHDASLARTGGIDVSVDSLDWTELAEVPLPQGERVMRLDDALATWPDIHWNLDIKDDRTLEPALALLDSPAVLERVCISSFSTARVRAARKELGPDAATGATPNEVAAWRDPSCEPCAGTSRHYLWPCRCLAPRAAFRWSPVAPSHWPTIWVSRYMSG